MADKIRMGFIGCGFMGQLAHIANYARLHDECDLVAVADVRPLLAKKVAARYGIRETYTDHRELLEKADVDAVAAIMYYGHHYAVVPDVIESGRHLITEKPMACSASSAREWKAAADAKRSCARPSRATPSASSATPGARPSQVACHSPPNSHSSQPMTWATM